MRARLDGPLVGIGSCDDGRMSKRPCVAGSVTTRDRLRLVPGDPFEKLPGISKDNRLLAASEPVDGAPLKHPDLDAVHVQPDLSRRVHGRQLDT
jgi:hypothetical protein